jgi:prepilin-type N-terminal cleavage/methylation domain-containing protein
MRKAFTLVELLVVVMVLPAATLVLSRVFATFIRDIPRMTRVVERNTTVLDMVQQMREDLDRAVALPNAFETRRSDGRTLLVKMADGVICYELQDGHGVRSVLSTDGQVENQEPRTWAFPEAVVTWSRWQESDTAYAVEIRTLVRQTIGSKVKDKLANSYVLFVHGMGKGGERL